MNIYQIAQEHQRILEILEEMDGEIDPDLEQEFNKIMSEGDDKVKAIYHVYRNIAAQLPGVVAEIQRITAIKKSLESNMDRLKYMIEAFMKATGRDRIEFEEMKMILAKKQDFNYSVFPEEFIEMVTTEKPKLAEFKAWCKLNPEDAEDHYGAKFTDGKYIQIK